MALFFAPSKMCSYKIGTGNAHAVSGLRNSELDS